MSVKAGGVFAGVFYIIFGVIWMSMTLSMPSGFGILFSLVGLLVIVYGLFIIFIIRRSFRGREFRPKESQIPEFEVPSDAEPEPHDGESNGFCPYCGSPLEKGFQYCGVCGRRL